MEPKSIKAGHEKGHHRSRLGILKKIDLFKVYVSDNLVLERYDSIRQRS